MSNVSETSPLGEERISRGQFIAEQVMANFREQHGGFNKLEDHLMTQAGIQQIAAEHPEWDMTGEKGDLRTREVWSRSEDVIL